MSSVSVQSPQILKNELKAAGVLDEQLYMAGARNAIHYNGNETVYLNGSEMIMGGFRFRGQYTKGIARSFPTADFRSVISHLNDLGAETVASASTWYAVFAVANEGDDTCSFKVMPFIRLGVPLSANVYPTVEAGVNSHEAAEAKPHSWGVGIDGAECLVVTSNQRYAGAGKVTTVISSDSLKIEFSDSHNMTQGDFVLPAPLGFDFYRYCGCYYNDEASAVTNIADDGYYVGSRGSNLTQLQSNGFDVGAVDSVKIRPLGNISPLACAVNVTSESAFTYSRVGTFYESLQTDGGLHTVAQSADHKEVTAGTIVISNTFKVTFGLYASYYYTNAGSLNTYRTLGKHLPWGYYEP